MMYSNFNKNRLNLGTKIKILRLRSFLIFLIAFQVAIAQEKVSGLIVDTEGKPIENVLIQAPELGVSTTSNANGEFVLSAISIACPVPPLVNVISAILVVSFISTAASAVPVDVVPEMLLFLNSVVPIVICEQPAKLVANIS